MMSGASPAAVQRILRHTDIRITTELYSHLAPEYLQSEIDRLSFRPPAPPENEPVEEQAAVVAGTNTDEGTPGFGSPVVPEAGGRPFPRAARRRERPSIRALAVVGAAGFEPTTSCSQSKRATNCATPRTPAREGREAADTSSLRCRCPHFLRSFSLKATARARKAAARWERLFLVARSISAMVRPSDGTRKRGS
jgi:hypothetical protein